MRLQAWLYLFHPASDTCYEAYTRGPCAADLKLVASVIRGGEAWCDFNGDYCPLPEFLHRKDCWRVGSPGKAADNSACKRDKKAPHVVRVNPLNFELECFSISEEFEPDYLDVTVQPGSDIAKLNESVRARYRCPLSGTIRHFLKLC